MAVCWNSPVPTVQRNRGPDVLNLKWACSIYACGWPLMQWRHFALEWETGRTQAFWGTWANHACKSNTANQKGGVCRIACGDHLCKLTTQRLVHPIHEHRQGHSLWPPHKPREQSLVEHTWQGWKKNLQDSWSVDCTICDVVIGCVTIKAVASKILLHVQTHQRSIINRFDDKVCEVAPPSYSAGSHVHLVSGFRWRRGQHTHFLVPRSIHTRNRNCHELSLVSPEVDEWGNTGQWVYEVVPKCLLTCMCDLLRCTNVCYCCQSS